MDDREQASLLGAADRSAAIADLIRRFSGDLDLLVQALLRSHGTPPWSPLTAEEQRILDLLTERQRQLIVQLCTPGTPKMSVVAERMGVKECTAHKHRERVYELLGIEARQDLLRWAVRAGLVRL